MDRRRTTGGLVMAGLLAVAGTTAGCSGETRDAPSASPNESAVPGSPEHADIAFLQMMVLHHRQALDMAGLAPERAEDQRVVDVAARIEAAQAPEILVIAQWLTEHGIDVPMPGDDPSEYDHAEHGHSGLMGMLTEKELEALADAGGSEFDRLFLEGMIAHHQGAVAMALVVLSEGVDPRVNELANDINAGQSAEIARLEQLLAGL